MKIKSAINSLLGRFPFLLSLARRIYMYVSYAFSNKIKSEGNIIRLSPDDKKHEYFFGYYDKSPWDATGRYVLCMKAVDTWSDPDPCQPAEVLLIDTQSNEIKSLATTRTWNVQQGCMAQWLGPDYSEYIIYNDVRNGKYCSIILNVKTLRERVLSAPVYSVSPDGKTALTLDFSRLHNLRKGYGYSLIPEKTLGINLPDATAVWKLNLVTGEVTEFIKYTDFANFQPRPEMQEKGSVHKVNHLMISPDGNRFMVLYRWFLGNKKYTRLITCSMDGSDMYLLSDDDMVSHCYWKNNTEILAFEHKHKEGDGYYLMKDKTSEYKHLWPSLKEDGHPSYCPIDNSLVVSDTYPSSKRIAEVKLLRENSEKEDVTVIAKVFAPFKYLNDTRCDLHPRWSRDGKKVCIDSVFEGHRGLYYIDIQL